VARRIGREADRPQRPDAAGGGACRIGGLVGPVGGSHVCGRTNGRDAGCDKAARRLEPTSRKCGLSSRPAAGPQAPHGTASESGTKTGRGVGWSSGRPQRLREPAASSCAAQATAGWSAAWCAARAEPAAEAPAGALGGSVFAGLFLLT